MSAAHTPMVVAAARALCKRASEVCGVDEQDNWKTYGDEWLADAQAVLDAAGAPELLEALKAVHDSAPECWWNLSIHVQLQVKAAIAKAGGEQ